MCSIKKLCLGFLLTKVISVIIRPEMEEAYQIILSITLTMKDCSLQYILQCFFSNSVLNNQSNGLPPVLRRWHSTGDRILVYSQVYLDIVFKFKSVFPRQMPFVHHTQFHFHFSFFKDQTIVNYDYNYFRCCVVKIYIISSFSSPQ